MTIKILFYIVLLCIFGCVSNDSTFENETIALNRYLGEDLNFEIQNYETNFIIFPASSGCGGCKSTLINTLLNDSIKSNVIFILPAEYINTRSKMNDSKILVDTSNNIERINAKTQLLVLIKEREKKIVSVTHINPSNIDSIVKDIKVDKIN